MRRPLITTQAYQRDARFKLLPAVFRGEYRIPAADSRTGKAHTLDLDHYGALFAELCEWQQSIHALEPDEVDLKHTHQLCNKFLKSIVRCACRTTRCPRPRRDDGRTVRGHVARARITYITRMLSSLARRSSAHVGWPVYAARDAMHAVGRHERAS
jgi:hypothetical protein